MAKEELIGKRRILSFQPFSVLGNGGGPRILRRLVEGREDEVVFFSFADSKKVVPSKIKEIPFILYPIQRSWMRSFLRTFFFNIRHRVLFNSHIKRLKNEVSKLDFDVLHILDHSIYSGALLDVAKAKNVPVWVSFHDHFKSTASSGIVTGELWKYSSKRMVISDEIGKHYSELYGAKDYIIVTDGLKQNEISPAKNSFSTNTLKVYFGGLLHLEYYELFESFHKALELFSKNKNRKVSLILRGTQNLDFLNNSKLEIEYRPFSIDNEVLRLEMNDADLLYLPIKYTDVEFYLYSFSTKMIGYLGASGNIFYHGPKEAAAAIFLEKNNCGIICDSLNIDEIESCLQKSLSEFTYSENAKKIAHERFEMGKMQEMFFN